MICSINFYDKFLRQAYEVCYVLSDNVLPPEASPALRSPKRTPQYAFCLRRIPAVFLRELTQQTICRTICRLVPTLHLTTGSPTVISLYSVPPSFGGDGGGFSSPIPWRGRGGSYMTFSTCSFICSSSSFMRTTMFCISARLLLLPVVLISRPISCAMKPSFLPCPWPSCMVWRK